MQKRMLFAGFTAAKKTIIQNWFTPHMCRKTYWIRSLLQIVTCECTTARVGGARPSTIDAWQCFRFDIRDCIKEWLVLCFYCPSLSPSLLTWLWAVEYVSVVLFCYILDVMLCYVWKKTKPPCKGFLSLQNGLSVWFTRLHNHGEDCWSDSCPEDNHWHPSQGG